MLQRWIYFDDVDAGETRTFKSNQRCILPTNPSKAEFDTKNGDVWTCSDKGVPGPFYFVVEFSEIDVPEWVLDELIGHRELRFTAEELAKAMPNVYDTYDETIDLGPCYDERGCVTSPGTPTGPHYTFTYRLTRLPDQVLEPQVGPGP